MPLIADVCTVPVILPHAVISGSAMGPNPSDEEQRHRIGISPLGTTGPGILPQTRMSIFSLVPLPCPWQRI
ncbi:hypothetical protein M422DRAFT_268816 [Sphaerobolus stellatus SS14]|uniref:Uncharacterized protein n=1 Tax=Sphaerobolus stellatus (strain SS14) TaxID=990650 RepID=A0A0C9ULI3_SPHS4|nr:hypothetical protein M422DRAFT_268816 [Sphaerobolus stellatus SS14]